MSTIATCSNKIGGKDMKLGRSSLFFGVLLLALPILVAAQRRPRPAPQITTPPPTQAPATPPKQEVALDWQTLKPENEEFSILMPRDATTEISKFDYHKFQLNTRLYMSAPTAAPVVGVVSMSGIKSNPASASDLERFNSYADAFKTFYAPKVRKDIPPKMILTATKPFHGYTARIYKLTIGDLNGTVHAVVTRKRFYAIALLNAKKDDALEEKFLSSFVIPDKPTEQPNTAAAEETQGQGEVATTASANDLQEKPRRDGTRNGVASEGAVNAGTNVRSNVNTNEDNTEFGTGSTQLQTDTQNQPANKPRPPVSGGMLNGKAIYLPMPEMPPGEKAGGVVMVQVLVDEGGNVIDAKAVSGPPALFASAVSAARFARFTPTLFMGEPVRVQGTLAYNFARAN
jgi:outer membrane biosynthesis protein TonB